MRKIINGKVYDTETATHVGGWDNGCYTTDFDYAGEDLYRKRTGEYFVHGEGGARSVYAELDGDGWSGGSAIRPLTYEGARAWAEEHLSAEEYEAEFGEVAEDEGEVAVTVRVPASAKAALDRECAATGRTRGDIVATLLDSAMPCVEQPYRTMWTIDPEGWDEGQVRDASNAVLYMGLAETSYTLGSGGSLSASAEAFRAAVRAELARRGDR